MHFGFQGGGLYIHYTLAIKSCLLKSEPKLQLFCRVNRENSNSEVLFYIWTCNLFRVIGLDC